MIIPTLFLRLRGVFGFLSAHPPPAACTHAHARTHVRRTPPLHIPHKQTHIDTHRHTHTHTCPCSPTHPAAEKDHVNPERAPSNQTNSTPTPTTQQAHNKHTQHHIHNKNNKQTHNNNNNKQKKTKQKNTKKKLTIEYRKTHIAIPYVSKSKQNRPWTIKTQLLGTYH